MLFRGAWAIEKGGSPCSFGRYGAQRHHFEAAHSIRLAPTGIGSVFGARLVDVATVSNSATQAMLEAYGSSAYVS